MGKYQARLAADAHARPRRGSALRRAASPRVIFTDPQVAAVGTPSLAAEQGIGARARRRDGRERRRLVRRPGAPGTARIVVDEARGVVVGATFTGAEIGGCCTRRRSRSSARCRSTGSAHAVPASRPAASCGCICSRATGSGDADADKLLRDLFDRDELTRAVLSRPSGRGHARKVVVEPVALKAGPAYRFTRHYADRTTDENLPAAQAEARVGELLGEYRQALLQSAEADWQVLGETVLRRPATRPDAERAHDRRKRRLLEEGVPVPFLVELGVMTAGREGAESRATTSSARSTASSSSSTTSSPRCPRRGRCGSSTSAAAAPTSPSRCITCSPSFAVARSSWSGST